MADLPARFPSSIEAMQAAIQGYCDGQGTIVFASLAL